MNPFVPFILDGHLKVKPPLIDLDLRKIIIIVPDDSILDALYENLGVRDFDELSKIKGAQSALIYSSVFVFHKVYKKYVSLAFITNVQVNYPEFAEDDDSLNFGVVDGITVLNVGDLEDDLPEYLHDIFKPKRKIMVQVVFLEGILLTDDASIVLRKEFKMPFGGFLEKMQNPENGPRPHFYPDYRGTQRYALLSGEFLRSLHKEDCIAIPKYGDTNMRTQDDDWSDMSIEVIIPEYIVLYGKNAERYISECFRSGKDFSVIYLTLNFYEGAKRRIGHANMLIYNRTRKEIERFDPHGDVEGMYNVSTLDKNLVDFLKANFGEYVDKYVPPLQLCPTMPKLFQAMDLQQKRRLGIMREGWCQTWAMWYAHLRLSNKNLSQEAVIRRAMTQLNEEPRGFIDIALAYQTFFQRFSNWKGDKRDDKLFEDMADEYRVSEEQK